MRLRMLLPVGLAAVLGATLALGIAKGVGWLHGTTNATYVIREQVVAAPATRTAASPSVAGFRPARIYQQRSAGVVTVFSFFLNGTESQGSGFVVDRSGVILTNAHVVTTAGDGAGGATARGAHVVFVEFSDGDRVQAKVVGWDVFDDIAVLRVDPKAHALAPVPLGRSGSVVIGQPVAAIGSPFGNTDSLSVGIVSATRSIPSLTSPYDVVDAIQIDAPINHGSSGGPLFDAQGRVIGVNAQIRGNGSTVGVGFAIPIDAARRSLQQLLAHGRVAYAYVGVGTDDLTPSLARRYDFPVLHGAVISQVESGSAAARAGLQAGSRVVAYAGQQVRLGGDVIVAIDGRPVRGTGDVVRIVGAHLRPGQTARFTVYRGSRRLVVPVTLTQRPMR